MRRQQKIAKIPIKTALSHSLAAGEDAIRKVTKSSHKKLLQNSKPAKSTLEHKA
jgi:hypothetical protein